MKTIKIHVSELYVNDIGYHIIACDGQKYQYNYCYCSKCHKEKRG